MGNQLKLSEIIKLKGAQHIILGNSGSGKTYFVMQLLEQLKELDNIYIFGNDENEWTKVKLKINFIHNSPFENKFLLTLKDCIVVFDDYRQDKNEEESFYKFANYYVRHNNICFILITHSVFKSNLYSKIVSSPSIFLTSSPSNLFLAQKYDKMFNTDVSSLLKKNIKDQTSSYRPVLYITPNYVINSVEELIKPTTHEKKVRMFKHDKSYYLLDTAKFKFEDPSLKNEENKSGINEILSDFEEMYPVRFKKLKKFIISLYDFLKESNLLNIDKTEIQIGKTKISFYDFVISSQDFSKKTVDPKLKTVLTHLKRNGFKVPKFTVQNPIYRTYIT